MTGWRVGYVVAPPSVAGVITKLQEPVVSCPSAVSQKAAMAAITGPQACVAEMRNAYRQRRDAVMTILDAADVRATVPHGAFYVLVDVSRVASETFTFARCLLTEHGVAVAPGETFGEVGCGHVRVSLAADQRLLEEGVRRLAAALTLA
jgi:aspartate/methionine/tyrosine aminotransferase